VSFSNSKKIQSILTKACLFYSNFSQATFSFPFFFLKESPKIHQSASLQPPPPPPKKKEEMSNSGLDPPPQLGRQFIVQDQKSERIIPLRQRCLFFQWAGSVLEPISFDFHLHYMITFKAETPVRPYSSPDDEDGCTVPNLAGSPLPLCFWVSCLSSGQSFTFSPAK